MKSLKLFSLLLFILLAAYVFLIMSGCGLVQQSSSSSSTLSISSQSPALNATGVASTSSLSITFNHTVNTNESTLQINLPTGHTAGTWEGTPIYTWSNGNKTLTIEGITGWAGGGATTVYVAVASTESFKDYGGNTLAAGTTLWKYVLASASGQYAVTGTVSHAQDLDIMVGAITSLGGGGSVESYVITTTNTPYTLALTNGSYYVFSTYPTSGAMSLVGVYGWGGSGGTIQATLDATAITVSGADLSSINFGLYATIEVPSIASRSPALNATGVAQTADLSITFSVAMSPESGGITTVPLVHTAGNPSGAVVPTWSEGNKTITYSGITSWSGGAGTVVYLVSTTEGGGGFQAANGAYLPVGLDLLKYTLE